MRKKILMACCNHWTAPCQVGSHHFARSFAAMGWDVAFVSHPISPLHLAGGMNRELQERYAIYKRGGERLLDGRLWTFVPGALLAPHNKPFLRGEWVHRHWQNLTYPDLVKTVAKAGFTEVDLIYFDNPNQLFWLDAIKHRKSFFRVADKNTGFERSTQATLRMEHELAQRTDVVVYTAENLKGYVESMGATSTLHVPNGVYFEHFARGSREMPREYGSIPRPVVVYVGAMSSWFDFELLNRAAEKLPAVSFVLIGPDEFARTRLRDLPNIHFLGQRAYAELPKYLFNADAGIIPFDVSRYPELVNSIHPLKLYEYMACGLPVVAAEWDELKSLNSPAALYRTVDEFVQNIDEAITKPHDKEALVRYAQGQDWSARVKTIFDYFRLAD